MRLREVNVNTAPQGGESGMKKASTATYISPPRNVAAAAAAAATAVPAKPHIPHHHHNHSHSHALNAQRSETFVMRHQPYNHHCVTTPMHDCHTIAAMHSATSECNCPPCTYYRSYYYGQQPEILQLGGIMTPMMYSQPVETEDMILRSIAAVPVMSLKNGVAQPQPQSSSAVMGGGAAPHNNNNNNNNFMEKFHATCPGRVVELSCTAAGKAVIQMSVRSQDLSVLEIVVSEMSVDVGTVALDVNGCHVLRAVVETCSPEQLDLIVGNLHETLILNMCTVSQYTRRVVQSLFERQAVDLSGVLDVLARNAVYLAATQQGCIALMRVYKVCDEESKKILMDPLLPQFATIALDPYGNYVVQCAMEFTDCVVAAQYVVSCFSGNLLSMSGDKFGSNVVEKAVRCCGHVPGVRRLLLDELVYNPAALQEVANDNYGNFVLQAVLECVTQPMEIKRVADRLRPALQRSPFAGKIESKLKAKRLPIADLLYPAPAATQQQQQQQHHLTPIPASQVQVHVMPNNNNNTQQQQMLQSHSNNGMNPSHTYSRPGGAQHKGNNHRGRAAMTVGGGNSDCADAQHYHRVLHQDCCTMGQQ